MTMMMMMMMMMMMINTTVSMQHAVQKLPYETYEFAEKSVFFLVVLKPMIILQYGL
jgi:hypothetical protein